MARAGSLLPLVAGEANNSHCAAVLNRSCSELGSLERREEDTTLKPDKGQIYPLSEVFSDTTFVEEKRLHRLGLSG